MTRRTGSRGAEGELAEAAAGLVDGTAAAERRYDIALDRFNSLGAADLDARIDEVLVGLGVGADVADRQVSTLSGGQEAKVALAAIQLSRFDITLLDEPTNDLDFEGLARLEDIGPIASGGPGHRLPRPGLPRAHRDHRARARRPQPDGAEYGGGWRGYQTERARARRHASEAYERLRPPASPAGDQSRPAAAVGHHRRPPGARHPRDNDKAQRDFRINRTEKFASKAQRRPSGPLDNLEAVEKPWEGWDLRLTIEEAARAGAVVARLDRSRSSNGGRSGWARSTSRSTGGSGWR